MPPHMTLLQVRKPHRHVGEHSAFTSLRIEVTSDKICDSTNAAEFAMPERKKCGRVCNSKFECAPWKTSSPCQRSCLKSGDYFPRDTTKSLSLKICILRPYEVPGQISRGRRYGGHHSPTILFCFGR